MIKGSHKSSKIEFYRLAPHVHFKLISARYHARELNIAPLSPPLPMAGISKLFLLIVMIIVDNEGQVHLVLVVDVFYLQNITRLNIVNHSHWATILVNIQVIQKPPYQLLAVTPLISYVHMTGFCIQLLSYYRTSSQ